MQPDRPSSTAELVCSWRALEYLLPEDQRILSDPYAREFLGTGRRAIIDVAERLPQGALYALFRRIDRFVHGARTFVLARHRAMEDLLASQEGLDQVVLLGAGYDTRSVRLAEELGDVTVFEVDHPATARRKQRLAPAIFGEIPQAKTVFVTIDFERESIRDKLLEAGLRPGLRTFWIWEGVSMYLEEEAVRATFDLVNALSAPGALLTFDVWAPAARGLRQIISRELPSLAMRLIFDEPFNWSPQLDALDPMLREHGLALIELTKASELVHRYTGRRPSWLQVLSSNLALCVVEVERT